MSQKGYRSERLQIQLVFFVDRKKFNTREKAEAAITKARKHFLQTGKSIAGVRIVGRWKNPDNRNPIHADWKTTEDRGQSLYDFWTTIQKGRGILG